MTFNEFIDKHVYPSLADKIKSAMVGEKNFELNCNPNSVKSSKEDIAFDALQVSDFKSGHLGYLPGETFPSIMFSRE